MGLPPLPIAIQIAIRNERTKLLATTLNNAALAFVIGGIIAPAITGNLVLGWHTLATLVWVGLGVCLHLSARAVLGRLR